MRIINLYNSTILFEIRNNIIKIYNLINFDYHISLSDTFKVILYINVTSIF